MSQESQRALTCILNLYRQSAPESMNLEKKSFYGKWFDESSKNAQTSLFWTFLQSGPRWRKQNEKGGKHNTTQHFTRQRHVNLCKRETI